jgi:hypothetical protein
MVLDAPAHDSPQIDMPIDRIPKSVATLVILDVIAVYVYCLRIKGVYPPSHPWSGFALILMAISILLVPRLTQVAFPWWALSATVVLAAGLWTFAAMHS